MKGNATVFFCCFFLLFLDSLRVGGNGEEQVPMVAESAIARLRINKNGRDQHGMDSLSMSYFLH